MTRKRKALAAIAADAGDAAAAGAPVLTRDDILSLLKTYSREELAGAIADTLALPAVRLLADADLTKRKLFVRNLEPSTSTNSLVAAFAPFGEIQEAAPIRGRGYGFVTFLHADSALLAVKNPHVTIDGRSVLVRFAANSSQEADPLPKVANAGSSGGSKDAGAGGLNDNSAVGSTDEAPRRIYIHNVPEDMPQEKLISVFGGFGEIEAGPFGYDKATGKSRGYALIVYRSVEAAKAALANPMKTVDGHHLFCKLANKKKSSNAEVPFGTASVNTAATTLAPAAGSGTVSVHAEAQAPVSSSKQSRTHGGFESAIVTYSPFPGGLMPGAAGLGQYQLSSVASEILGLTTAAGGRTCKLNSTVTGAPGSSGPVPGDSGLGGSLGGTGLGITSAGASRLGGVSAGDTGLGGASVGGPGLGGTSVGSSVLGGAFVGGPGLGGASLGVSGLGGASVGVAGLSGASLGVSGLGGASVGGAGLRVASAGGPGPGGLSVRGAGLGAASVGDPGLGGASLGGSRIEGASLGVSGIGTTALGTTIRSGIPPTVPVIGVDGVGSSYGQPSASQPCKFSGLGGLGVVASTGLGFGAFPYGLQQQGLSRISSGSFGKNAALYSLSGSSLEAAHQTKIQQQATTPSGTRNGAALYPTLPPSYL